MRAVFVGLVAAAAVALNGVEASLAFELEGNSAEDQLLGGNNQSTGDPGSGKRDEERKTKATSGAQPAASKPSVQVSKIDGATITISQCKRTQDKVYCDGSISVRSRTNISLQCYSGSYVVADNKEMGCLSVQVQGMASWSYVAVGVEGGESVPMRVAFSPTSSQAIALLNLVVSTTDSRNETLAYRNLAIHTAN